MRTLRVLRFSFILVGFILTFTTAQAVQAAQIAEKVVFIEVDCYSQKDVSSLMPLLKEAEDKGYRLAVFITPSLAEKNSQLVEYLLSRGHTVGVLGEFDITSLIYEEQLSYLRKAFFTLRKIAGKSHKIVDFKPYKYKFNNDTLRALQAIHARSISGTFKYNDSYCKCWYAKSVGEITFPYPINMNLMAVPVSKLGEKLLDTSNPNLFDDAKVKIQEDSPDPVIIGLSPSKVDLKEFSNFLDYLKENGVKIKQVFAQDAWISYLNITVPLIASPHDEISVKIDYTSTKYCPKYRFKIYGRYECTNQWYCDLLNAGSKSACIQMCSSLHPSFTVICPSICELVINSEAYRWQELKGAGDPDMCQYVYTGDHSFTTNITIPSPPLIGGDKFRIRVVAQASHGTCDITDPGWPTIDTYMAMDEEVITISRYFKPLIDEDGKPMVNGKPTEKIDVAFLQDGTFSEEIFIDISRNLIRKGYESNSSTLDTYPLNENLDKFNFYYSTLPVQVSYRLEESERYCWPEFTIPNALQDSFIDVFVVLHVCPSYCNYYCRDYSMYNPNAFSTEFFEENVFVHESGHAIFGLADEYADSDCPSSTYYFEPQPYPNIWDTIEECENFATQHGIPTSTCAEFYVCNSGICSIPRLKPKSWCGPWYKINEGPSIMDSNEGRWSTAARVRVSKILENVEKWEKNHGFGVRGYGKAAKSIVLELNINNGTFTLLSTRIVDTPPRNLPQPAFYNLTLYSPDGREIITIPFADPRIKLYQNGSSNFKDNVNFTLVVPYYYNINYAQIINKTGAVLQVIDLSEYTTSFINGTITDPTGVAVEALVQLSGTETVSAYTDENGSFAINGLEPGSYTINVLPDPLSNLLPYSTTFTIQRGEARTFQIQLQQAGSIKGKVVDVYGNPVEDVHFHLGGYEPPMYATNESGIFIIPYLYGGSYTVYMVEGYGAWFEDGGNYIGYGYSMSVDVLQGETSRIKIVKIDGTDYESFFTDSGEITVIVEHGYLPETPFIADFSDVPHPPEEFPYPINFRISGLTPGQKVNVTLILPENVSSDTEYWKYGPTSNNQRSHWYQIPLLSNDGDRIIMIQLQDGGIGDDDTQANGEILFSLPDSYELDDTMNNATTISIGVPQHHNFHRPGDEDWIRFYAVAGKTYNISTFNLGENSDTYIYLYDSEGNLIAYNDDFIGVASRIEWTCQESGYYYVKVRHYNSAIYGSGTEYWIEIDGYSPVRVSIEAPEIAFLNQTFDTRVVVDTVTNLAGFQLFVTYDPSVLEYEGYTLGDRTSNFTINYDIPSTGMVEISALTFSPVTDSVTGTDVEILKIRFRAVSEGTTSVGFGERSQLKKYDTSLNQIVNVQGVSFESASLTVTASFPGDLDGDGDVDFNDLIAELNLILTGNYNSAGDVDGDGDIDFNDLIRVLNTILTNN
jgi:hypothetical protein